MHFSEKNFVQAHFKNLGTNFNTKIYFDTRVVQYTCTSAAGFQKMKKNFRVSLDGNCHPRMQ